MSRKLIALVVTTGLLAGTTGVSAQTPSAGTRPAAVRTVVPQKSPLPPAGPAGIKAAQGVSDRGVLIASGLILTGIVAAMLLIDDDEETTTTTGSD